MAHPELLEHARRHFEQHLQVELAALLAPLDAQHPAGYSVKGSGVHQAILHARRAEDPGLPQGPWERELKRADWDTVATLVCDTLARRCKDLQLAAWLLEAQIHRCGIAGVAPVLVLLDELLGRFGDALHPQEAGGGAEHRANVLRWINRKLLPALKQLPLTACGAQEHGWAEREAAWRHEQHKPAAGAAAEGATLQDFVDAMAATPVEHHLGMQADLRHAIAALAQLADTVDACFPEDPPSLAGLASLLKEMLAAVDAELHRRGVDTRLPEPQPAPAAAHEGTAEAVEPVRADERAHAYAMLEEAARTLLQTDPHSPAPYLVQRAIEWGRLSASELYRELFIQRGGQLNIFELVGLEVPQESAQ